MTSTVLITGCNRGLGLEMARQYAHEGWQVHACARDLDSAIELKALAQNQTSITLHQLDVADDNQISALASQLSGTAIDLLINNAGVYGPKGLSLDQLDRQTWLDVLNINTVSPLMVVRAFLPNLRNGAMKKVAILSSKMGSLEDNTSGGSHIYRSGKAAVNQVVKSLSIDLAGEGIQTVALHPGWVLTDMGGPNALITANQSVGGMRRVIERLNDATNGKFIAYDGQIIPW